MEGFVKVLRKMFRHPVSIAGIILVLLFLSIAIFAPLLAPPAYPWNPYMMPQSGLSAVPQPPSPQHIFGTTQGQYDIYYGVIWGTRTALEVGVVVIGLALVIGILIGTLAAYFGGWVDELLMRITDIFLAFPFFVGVIVVITIIGPGITNVMWALVIFYWMTYARLIRGSILEVKENQYVMAAVALGTPGGRIITRHLLPNSIYPVIIQASMDMATIPLTAAALSFLGLGAPVGYADWGQLASFARNWIITPSGGNPFQYWYTIFFPSVTIVLYALGWNLLGDTLRDILDPRMLI
ncbi:ABC transporter permease [Athalassotoga saccharophila]|uniref:ABC transporter permease n=1 Tax=Athalassotoga saccharophila TaxID=1441386 RepID=UPI00137B8A09|nr:ABC transporter permease [Athalassotoga saccharophila]BBJ27959.1 putative D,D-dipeptide transport system permease protein DdpC [Athalassotoga saccharophila]